MVPIAEGTDTLDDEDEEVPNDVDDEDDGVPDDVDDEDEEDAEDELLLAVAVLVSVPAISLTPLAFMSMVRDTVSYPFRLISTVWLPTERPLISHGVEPFSVPST